MSYDIKYRLRAIAYWNDGHPSTNQRMYKNKDGKWTDITVRFWKNHDEI